MIGLRRTPSPGGSKCSCRTRTSRSDVGARWLGAWPAGVGRRCPVANGLDCRCRCAEYGGIEAVLLRDGEWSGDLVQRRRDGTKITVAARKALCRESDGRAIALVENVADVIELRATRAELRRLNASLEMRVREEVAARQAAQAASEPRRVCRRLRGLRGLSLWSPKRSGRHRFGMHLRCVSGRCGWYWSMRGTTPRNGRRSAR